MGASPFDFEHAEFNLRIDWVVLRLLLFTDATMAAKELLRGHILECGYYEKLWRQQSHGYEGPKFVHRHVVRKVEAHRWDAVRIRGRQPSYVIIDDPCYPR